MFDLRQHEELLPDFEPVRGKLSILKYVAYRASRARYRKTLGPVQGYLLLVDAAPVKVPFNGGTSGRAGPWSWRG